METIGRRARKAAVSERTLRFYDRVGLLPPARHTPARYRLYGDEHLARLQQMLALKTFWQNLGSLPETERPVPMPSHNVAEQAFMERALAAYEERGQGT